MCFMFVLGIVLYGTTVLIPQYPAVAPRLLRRQSAGEALAAGGFTMMLMMPRLRFSRFQTRSARHDDVVRLWRHGNRFALLHVSRTSPSASISGPPPCCGSIRWLGLAFIFVPSNVAVLCRHPARERIIKSPAMISFIRNIGGSIGIALISHFHHSRRAAPASDLSRRQHESIGNPRFTAKWSNGLTATLQSARAVSMADAVAPGLRPRLRAFSLQQATTLAYGPTWSPWMALAVAGPRAPHLPHETPAEKRRRSAANALDSRSSQCNSTAILRSTSGGDTPVGAAAHNSASRISFCKTPFATDARLPVPLLGALTLFSLNICFAPGTKADTASVPPRTIRGDTSARIFRWREVTTLFWDNGGVSPHQRLGPHLPPARPSTKFKPRLGRFRRPPRANAQRFRNRSHCHPR